MTTHRYALFRFDGPESYFNYNKLPMPVLSEKSYPKGHVGGSRLNGSSTHNFDSFRGQNSTAENLLQSGKNQAPWNPTNGSGNSGTYSEAAPQRSPSPHTSSFVRASPSPPPSPSPATGQADRDGLQRQVDSLKAQVAASRATIDDLNDQIRRMISAQGTTASNEQLLAKAQRTTAELEQHKNALNVALNEKANIERVANDNREKLQDALKTIDMQKAQLEALRTERTLTEPAVHEQRKNMAEALKQVDLLSAKVKNLENERRIFEPLFTETKKKLSDAQAETNSLRLQVQAMESERSVTGPMLETNKRKLQEAYAEIEGLKSQVLRMNQERALKEPASDETFRQLQEAQATIAKLKTDLSNVENEKYVHLQAVQDLTRKVAQAEHAVKLSQESVTERTVRIDNMKQALADRDAGVAELNGIKEALFKANEELAFELRKREDRIVILEKELEAKTQLQAQFKAEIQDLKSNLEKMEAFIEDIPLMEAQIETLQRERDYLSKALNERTTEAETFYAKYQEAKGGLDERDKKIKALIVENSGAEIAENELVKAKNEVAKLRNEKATLETRLNEATVFGKDHEAAERKLRLLNDEVQRLLADNAKLTQLLEANGDLESQVRSFQTKMERFDRRNQEKFEDYERNKRLYVARIEELERQLKAHPNTKDIPLEVQELTQGLFEYEKRVGQLRGENEMLYDKVDHLEVAVTKMRREIGELSARAGRGLGSDKELTRRSVQDMGDTGITKDPREAGSILVAKLQELKDDFVAAHGHRSIREYEKSLEEYEASKLRSFYNNVSAKIDWLIQRAVGLQEAQSKALESLEREIGALAGKDGSLRRTLDSQHFKRNSDAGLRDQGDLAAEVERSRRTISGLRKEVAAEKSAAIEASHLIDEREKEIQQLRAEQKRLMGYVSHYKASTDQMEQKMKLLMDKLERMRSKNQQLAEANGRLSMRSVPDPRADDYEDLVAENEDLKHEVARLQDALHNLEATDSRNGGWH